MTTIAEYVDPFIHKVQAAGKQLEDFSNLVASREQDILRGVKRLTQALDKCVGIDASSEASPIKKLLQESLSHYRLILREWSTLIVERIEGKEFMNQFEKSIILAVFGSVNAGKSTLGNFIAGVPFRDGVDDREVPYSSEAPQFYVYDWSDGQRDRGERPLPANRFRENEVQETSTIQYFTLDNGLTWVDTPGIHSLDAEYEDLAKKYVNYADLILFVSSSSSPAKADEIAEMERLTQKEKQLLVAITKSDRTESDVVNGVEVKTRVPKSSFDRRQQEEYMDKLIHGRGIDRNLRDPRFVSLSSYLALEALRTNDVDKFEASGYPLLYEQLGGVLSKHAIELKTERPRLEMNTLIRELREGFVSKGTRVDGLVQMGEKFKSVQDELLRTGEQLRLLHTELFRELRMNIEARIESELTALSFRFDQGESITSHQINNLIEQHALRELNQLIARRVGDRLSDFQHKQIQSMPLQINAEFKGSYQEHEFTQYATKEVSRDPRGLVENLQSLFLDKKFTELRIDEKKEIRQVRVGNNSAQLLEQVLEQMEQQLAPHVQSVIHELADQYVAEQSSMLTQLQDAIESFEAELHTMRFQEEVPV
ncbi:hypothetical protein PCCS19_41960 [Paenibacillus sp. CCS19]|uniref:dynamin family protein n=1 Tax=Paenibacillus sp. CCS19 TaxID=3158387 RepID=UPI00256BA11A|nr:dynamin family protein [Paenibacillus cellulosilyticus]GMK41140.1 hypothetical protein PCCS19_41960 [Paenibacillus cellulosilyticus]